MRFNLPKIELRKLNPRLYLIYYGGETVAELGLSSSGWQVHYRAVFDKLNPADQAEFREQIPKHTEELVVVWKVTQRIFK